MRLNNNALLRRVALILAVVTTVCAPGLFASDGVQTLDGEFLWSSQRERGDLEATFESTGDGEWNVSFRFQWSGQPRTFSGTATGSLTDGPLRGTVYNENERRTWKFAGSFKDGVFRGEHEELKRGRSVDTGTLTLRR
ncbi:MAG: hypothetical protein AAGC60_22945 [Acidobacteriota bacterium]